jgi:hypothetical protein
MFKWVCLLVAIVALSAYGWMLNDIRLQVREVTVKADQHLPAILASTQRVTTQLDQHLPRLLNKAETAATEIDAALPRLIKNSEQAAATLDRQLPRLVMSTETTLDGVSDLTASFGHYRALMGLAHPGSQNKGLLSYGSSILDLIEGQPATIGLKKPSGEPGLRAARPAKQWAGAARKDNQFLSLVATSKADVVHGLARTESAVPWYIQVGTELPRLLGDWIVANHPESKELK